MIENPASSTEIRHVLASVLTSIGAGRQILEGVENADFGDDFLGFQRGGVLTSLAQLEAADPESYLEALGYFGPQAVFEIGQGIAGSQETKALTTFRAAVLRFARLEMDADEAALLCDPRNRFKGQILLTHSNPQSDLVSAWLEPVMAWLEDPRKEPKDFPDSGDFFVLGLALGKLDYGGGPNDIFLCNERALRLIDEALRLADENPEPDDATKIRVGTLLGVAGHALYVNGYDIFNRKESEKLTLTQMLENATSGARMWTESVITRAQEMDPDLAREDIMDKIRADETDIAGKMLRSADRIEPYIGKIRALAQGEGPYRDLFTHPVRRVYDLDGKSLAGKVAAALKASSQDVAPRQDLPRLENF